MFESEHSTADRGPGDGQALVRYGGAPLPTLVERLTADFYAWERRGRGWQVFDRPVVIEPPFRPFFFSDSAFAPAVDDGRIPTLFSSLLDRLRAWRSGRHVEVEAVGFGNLPDEAYWEPEAEYLTDTPPLVAIRVSLPPQVKVAREAAEGLLLSLSSVSAPLSFEIVGAADRTEIQFVAREGDAPAVRDQLLAHFPDAALAEEKCRTEEVRDPSGSEPPVVVVDFGLSHEFMLPLRTFRSLDVDPLIGVVGALDDLRPGETGTLQVLFEPARAPWAHHALLAVSDGEGGPFFADAPQVVRLAQEKVSRPLFAAVVRVAARSANPARAWEIARRLAGVLRQFSRPASNEFIPLSDADYDPLDHEADFLKRRSRRSGMLLNVEELVSLVHPPSASVRSRKLDRERRKTKAAPEALAGHALVLGENQHAGRRLTVTLSEAQRLRHTHVIGASGTGKSHLLLNLIVQDLESGAGVAVLDPHGDLVEEVLGRIPEDRTAEVVLLDPSDDAFPVGFNVLSAHSPVEKDLISSDMVAVFRRLSTSWGDQMTAVLGNAVAVFLESEKGGTLWDLRRFLVEPSFRKDFLSTVTDPEVVFFWEKEFPLLTGKPQAPLLTRLNTFLRHRLVRHMVAQPENRVDFAEIMNDGRIFLAKLAQGAIGVENAHLLGSLLVSKFHQIALSRQEMVQAERRPFHLYIDEFHNFTTPTMAAILAGARKYGLGLTLAHQDLEQLKRRDPELLSAVLTNPAARICFRVGDLDAKRLADGFRDFGPEDLQNLGVGEAICRVERADWDFTLSTLPLPELAPDLARARRDAVVASSRERVGTPAGDVERFLDEARAQSAADSEASPRREKAARRARAVEGRAEVAPARERPQEAGTAGERGSIERPRPVAPPATPPLGKGGPEHVELQERIKRWAGGRGWLVTVEESVLEGRGRIDVSLERAGWRVACEISVSSTAEDELGNARKCLEAGFDDVVMVYPSRTRLRNAAERIKQALTEDEAARVSFVTPEDLWQLLEEREAKLAGGRRTVRGWAVETRHTTVEPDEAERRTTGVLKAFRRLWSRKS